MNDTLRIDNGAERVEFALAAEGIDIESVVVEGSQSGNFVKRDGIIKNEMISFAGLCKMACCNLAESFENSASVTVGYSDAISGARQIKMLGLAGTYTQILDENRPIMRGLSAPYGLSYTCLLYTSTAAARAERPGIGHRLYAHARRDRACLLYTSRCV